MRSSSTSEDWSMNCISYIQGTVTPTIPLSYFTYSGFANQWFGRESWFVFPTTVVTILKCTFFLKTRLSPFEATVLRVTVIIHHSSVVPPAIPKHCISKLLPTLESHNYPFPNIPFPRHEFPYHSLACPFSAPLLQYWRLGHFWFYIW